MSVYNFLFLDGYNSMDITPDDLELFCWRKVLKILSLAFINFRTT